MLDLETLQQMKNVDIRTVDPSTVKDAREIIINTDLPVKERMEEYIRQTGNPYIVKVGKIIVKLRFSDTTLSADDCFEQYMKTC